MANSHIERKHEEDDEELGHGSAHYGVHEKCDHRHRQTSPRDTRKTAQSLLRRRTLAAPVPNPRWHRPRSPAYPARDGVWYASGVRWEHEWAAALGALPGAAIAMPAFAGSDYGCEGRWAAAKKAKRAASEAPAAKKAAKTSRAEGCSQSGEASTGPEAGSAEESHREAACPERTTGRSGRTGSCYAERTDCD